MTQRTFALRIALIGIFVATVAIGCQTEPKTSTAPGTMTDDQVENIVRRSYQYVAMYNVNNKFAMDPANPASTEGWNRIKANTTLLDHTVQAIARPNNDSLYIAAMLDLRNEPVILDIPAFDSKYVSLMVTGYDHYVNVPMSVTKGDFKKPEKILFYSARTQNYDGQPIDGIDRTFEAPGDFISAVFRVMPHANEPKRFEKIKGEMQSVKVLTLSEYLGKPPVPVDDPGFPPFGATDIDIFANNFQEVMQFIVNHTTFDPNDELDQKLLAALEPLGIKPDSTFDPAAAPKIDSAQFRRIAEKVQKEEFAKALSPDFSVIGKELFKIKGEATHEALVIQTVLGPIGLPATEAIYPPILTEDGEPMNALHDYVIRMGPDDMPPAKAFWSVTLYDSKNGFFIPNDRKKYSVGENGGMKLDPKGGIEIWIAAEKPKDVPEENWLPINRQDEVLDAIMRIYAPDAEKAATWTAPKAVKVTPAS